MKLFRFLWLLLPGLVVAQPNTVTLPFRTKAEISAYTVQTWQTNLNAVAMDEGNSLYLFHPDSVAVVDGSTVLSATGVAGRWLVTPTSVVGGGTGSSNAPTALLNLGAVAKAGDTMTGPLLTVGLTNTGGFTNTGSLAVLGTTLTTGLTNTGGFTNTGLVYVGGHLMLGTTNVATALQAVSTNAITQFVQTNVTDETSAPPIAKNLGLPRYVLNQAALAAENGTTGPQSYVTLGRTTAGDGGGGLWIVKAAAPAWHVAGSGTTNMVTALAGGGYAVRDDVLQGNPINVKWFGAFPDDSVDDADAINSAIIVAVTPQIMISGMPRVHIPYGIYDINTTSIIITNLTTSNSGFILEGDGIGTVLKTTNTTSFSIIRQPETIASVPGFMKIRDLALRGNIVWTGTDWLPTGPDHPTAGTIGLNVVATNFEVDNVSAQGLSTGFYSSVSPHAVSGSYRNLWATLCYYGFYGYAPSGATQISMNGSGNKVGIGMVLSSRTTINYSNIEGGSTVLALTNCWGTIIESCALEGGTNGPVVLSNCKNTKFVNSKIMVGGTGAGGTGSGFLASVKMVDGTDQVTVENCELSGEPSSDKPGRPFYMDTTSGGFRMDTLPLYTVSTWPVNTATLYENSIGGGQNSYLLANTFNYIHDGGFESGVSHWTAWDQWAPPTTIKGTLSSSSVPHSGHKSLQFTFNGEPNWWSPILSHTPYTPIPVGTYYMSYWLQVSPELVGDVTQPFFTWRINGTNYNDGVELYTFDSSAMHDRTNWNFFSSRVVVPVAATNFYASTGTGHRSPAGSYVRIDDLILTPAASTSHENLLKGTVRDIHPILRNPSLLAIDGTHLTTSGAMVPYWTGTTWARGQTNILTIPQLRFPIDGEDSIANLSNYVTPSFTGNEKAITGQSSESFQKSWQAVSVALAAFPTNGFVAYGTDTVLYYQTGSAVTASNTSSAITGMYLSASVPTVGQEYTLSFSALANENATLRLPSSGVWTNVVWQTPQSLTTALQNYKVSWTAVNTQGFLVFRDRDSVNDTITISNVQYSVGGYWPVDGVRVFASAIDVTKGWRHVGPNTYSTKVIAAASDWTYVDADNIVLAPTGAIDLTTALPTLLPGTVVGQVVDITSSSTDAVTFNDNGSVAGTLLELGAATRAISTNDVLRLKWNGKSWIESGFWDN